MNVLVAHIPHAVPVVAIWGLMLRYWMAQRRLERDGDATAPAPPAPLPATAPSSAVRAPAPVRRSVAVRGLLALGPLVGALATGLVVYALNLGRGHAGDTAIWTHVGLSLLALLLVAYKISDIGLARLRQSMRGGPAWRATGSLILLALWVPLLASGVALLVAPSEASFTAYAHLIASVWWTGLFLWHLRRYLARATRAALARPAAGVAPAPVPVPGGTPARPAASTSRASAPRSTPRHRRSPAPTTASPGKLRPIGEHPPAGVTAEDGAPASTAGR